MSLADRQAALVADLLHIEDAQERLAAIVERSRHRPRLPPAARSAAHRVQGCQTPVWLVAEIRAGTLHVEADADSPLVRALVCLLCDVVAGATTAEVMQTPLTVIDDLGLHRLLSPTRLAGLAAVRAQLVARALAFSDPA